LRARRHAKSDGCISVFRLESRYAYLAAERGLDERNANARDQIGPVALESRVVLDVYLDVKVARGSATRAWNALIGDA